MRTTGVARDEDAWRATFVGRVVVAGSDSLADFVNRPPGDFFDVQGVGVKDAPRGLDDLFHGVVAVGDPLILA